jgi:hypothetical protein
MAGNFNSFIVKKKKVPTIDARHKSSRKGEGRSPTTRTYSMCEHLKIATTTTFQMREHWHRNCGVQERRQRRMTKVQVLVPVMKGVESEGVRTKTKRTRRRRRRMITTT